MKKLLSSFIILCLFLFLAWGIVGWFIGAQAESALKNYLVALEKVPGEKLFRAELIDYKKTILGAKARIKVSSDTSFLNERLGDFEVDAHFLNGPVFVDLDANDNTSFLNSIKLNTGTSRWKVAIIESSVDENKGEYLKSIFPNGLPIAIVRTDFDNKAYYQSKLITKYADAMLTGTYNLANGDNQGAVNFNQIKYGVPPHVITAEHAILNYQHQRGITSAYKPGTTHLTITGLKINHENFSKQPLSLNLSADMAIQSELNDVLNGLLKVKLKKTAENIIPIENLDMTIQFDNIPASGFIELSEEQAKHDNIRQQIQWTLEEKGEFPEGQDQLWQLNDQLSTMQQQLPEKIAGLFLKSNKSKISINANAFNKLINQDIKEGIESSFEGEISLDNSSKSDQEIKNLLMGEGHIKLSNNLFKYLKPFFNLLLKSNHPPTTADFHLVYQQGELSVNN